MKTAEEIKKSLENCTECGGCTICDYCAECNCEPDCLEPFLNGWPLMCDALMLIRQLEAQVPKWISVEERLPGDREDTVGEVVNVMVDKSGVICSTSGYYNWQAEEWYIYDGTMAAYRTSLYGWIVVAWMPLPEPLKEG